MSVVPSSYIQNEVITVRNNEYIVTMSVGIVGKSWLMVNVITKAMNYNELIIRQNNVYLKCHSN